MKKLMPVLALILISKWLYAMEQIEPETMKILHVAYEYKDAQVGGLGAVTKALIPLQNSFKGGKAMKASIIMPGYRYLLEKYEQLLEDEGEVQ